MHSLRLIDLQKRGIVFYCNKLDGGHFVVPDELVPSVRKVLGISDLGMGLLISRKFLLVLLVTGLLATPFTWFLLKNWLENFTYRIPLHWELFLLAPMTIFLLISGIMFIKWWQFKRSNLAQVIKYE